jgi:hypothetical protein
MSSPRPQSSPNLLGSMNLKKNFNFVKGILWNLLPILINGYTDSVILHQIFHEYFLRDRHLVDDTV